MNVAFLYTTSLIVDNYCFVLDSASNSNNYYMLTSEKGLGFGGGGNFALFVDGDLNTGSTGPCETFASPALTNVNPFTCVECELYEIESPYT